jgi:carbonic anhydrase
VSAELVFDQGLGDIFSIRIAGNFINEDILGSMEFACKIAGSKLIVVLGHTRCGAITGAVNNVEMGNLTKMLQKIKPSIEAVKKQNGIADKADLIQLVAQENVHQAILNIKKRSLILDEMLNNGEIGIVGAMYNVETGEVVFQDIEIHNEKLTQTI